MTTYLYREDWLEARDRLTTWWNGGDIGRALMQVTAPRQDPIEAIEELPEPEGWVTTYSTKDMDYKINVGLRGCVSSHYLGEAVPMMDAGNLAPNCLALYLGCHGVEMPGTVWCEPFVENPGDIKFRYDPENFYWQFSCEAFRRSVKLGKGKCLHQFPDLIEGLDTLAAMRGTDNVLLDLVERPEWVHACLRRTTDRYFHHYDILYDMIRDEVGGSIFWCWAPGRMAKFQCDFSAMLSPGMFRDFMGPVLREMTERVSYCMYHWDGPGALCHLDTLLSLPDLDMIQWTPGAGAEGSWNRRWWPYYHTILDAGKKIFIGANSEEHLLDLKREFGEQTKRMLVRMSANTPEEGEAFLRLMEV